VSFLPSPAANTAIVVPGTQNLMAHFAPITGIVLIANRSS
jgi:hypothetical protein